MCVRAMHRMYLGCIFAAECEIRVGKTGKRWDRLLWGLEHLSEWIGCRKCGEYASSGDMFVEDKTCRGSVASSCRTPLCLGARVRYSRRKG